MTKLWQKNDFLEKGIDGTDCIHPSSMREDSLDDKVEQLGRAVQLMDGTTDANSGDVCGFSMSSISLTSVIILICGKNAVCPTRLMIGVHTALLICQSAPKS